MYWGDLRGVRTCPLRRQQSYLWPLVYKGKLWTGRQLWGHLAHGGSGSALAWMVWKTGVSDVTRLQFQTAQKHPTLPFPVAFPFLVSYFWNYFDYFYLCACVLRACVHAHLSVWVQTCKCHSTHMKVSCHLTISSVSCHFVLCLRWRF